MTSELPKELSDALEADARAKAIFHAMSASHRNEYARWVAEAKRADTRRSRSEKAVRMILAKAQQSAGPR